MDSKEMQTKMAEIGIEIEILRQGRLLQTKKAWREMGDKAEAAKAILSSLGWEISTQGAIWRAPFDSSPMLRSNRTPEEDAALARALDEWTHNH